MEMHLNVASIAFKSKAKMGIMVAVSVDPLFHRASSCSGCIAQTVFVSQLLHI